MAHRAGGTGERITNRAEEYLETILNMTVEGREVYAARLAERLGISAPTVSAALGRLVRDGLVAVDPQRRISLTPPGHEAAVAIVRRHRLIERLLTDYLGLSWADCHEEACLLEHAVSPRVEERLYERLGRPSTCPHGNPIPEGTVIRMPECRELASIPAGTTVEIVRITEEVSDDHRMMVFLEANLLMPGERFVILSRSLEADTITIRRVGDTHPELTVATKAAAALFVTPL